VTDLNMLSFSQHRNREQAVIILRMAIERSAPEQGD